MDDTTNEQRRKHEENNARQEAMYLLYYLKQKHQRGMETSADVALRTKLAEWLGLNDE